MVVKYNIYNLEVTKAAIKMAKQGVLISLDLASFEMVQKFSAALLELPESGNIDISKGLIINSKRKTNIPLRTQVEHMS